MFASRSALTPDCEADTCFDESQMPARDHRGLAQACTSLALRTFAIRCHHVWCSFLCHPWPQSDRVNWPVKDRLRECGTRSTPTIRSNPEPAWSEASFPIAR